MALRWRQVVACVTAAFVLLVNVYCACAHSAAPREEVAAQDLPPCHAQRAAGKHGAPGHAPAPSSELPCQHCKSAFATDTAKQATPLQPLFAAWALNAASFDVVTEIAGPHDAALALDLPPPRPALSLLSLHCALNT